jgi:hypothetical protein
MTRVGRRAVRTDDLPQLPADILDFGREVDELVSLGQCPHEQRDSLAIRLRHDASGTIDASVC